jgi:hypothetical protein
METVAWARHDSALLLQSLLLRTTLHATGTPLFNPSQAQQLSDQALVLARELGDRAAEAKINWNLMLLGRFNGQNEAAIEHGERALASARALNLRELMAFTLNALVGVSQ